MATGGWILAATCMAPRGEPVLGDETGILGVADASASGVAEVRFVHAIPGVTAVKIDADEHLAFAAANYRVVTPYAEVGADKSRFVLRGADGTTLATVEEHLDADERYTLIATRDARGEPALTVVRDAPAAAVHSAGDTRSMYVNVSN